MVTKETERGVEVARTQNEPQTIEEEMPEPKNDFPEASQPQAENNGASQEMTDLQ